VARFKTRGGKEKFDQRVNKKSQKNFASQGIGPETGRGGGKGQEESNRGENGNWECSCERDTIEGEKERKIGGRPRATKKKKGIHGTIICGRKGNSKGIEGTGRAKGKKRREKE